MHVAERTVVFALSVIKAYRNLEDDPVGRIIGKQLLRCGTSIGANVHGAQAAQSRADFVSKISIAHKEARETIYWSRARMAAEVCTSSLLAPLLDEATQLKKIFSASLLTAKQNSRPSRPETKRPLFTLHS